MPEVRPERTGWRDEGISERHRRWGWDCPAVDIDFLLIEYDSGEPKAIVEYKNEHAKPQYASHPSYQSLIKLGNKAEVPVLAVRYTDDYSKYTVTALNKEGRVYIPENYTVLTEREYVALLYRIRGREASEELLNSMYTKI